MQGKSKKRRIRRADLEKNKILTGFRKLVQLIMMTKNVCNYLYGSAFLCYQNRTEHIQLVGYVTSNSEVSISLQSPLFAVSSAAALTLHSDQVTFLLSCPLAGAVLAVTSTNTNRRNVVSLFDQMWVFICSTNM